jgi:hypothetical protein
MSKIKKTSPIPSSKIKRSEAPNPRLRFSFILFDASDAEVCPPHFNNGYVQKLMERLKNLSSWTINDFLNTKSKSLRNHVISWEDTSRKNGFNLSEQYSAYSAFQFSLSANEWGRVHGLLIDDTFYIIWLDQNHKVYAERG